MAIPLARLPRFLVLDPVSTVRIEIDLESPSCEIDVDPQNLRSGRSFVLLIGQRGGPYLQRMRLSGRARILFRPKSIGQYLLMLANPHRDPLVLRLRGHNIRARARSVGRVGSRGPGSGRRSSRSLARPRRSPKEISGARASFGPVERPPEDLDRSFS